MAMGFVGQVLCLPDSGAWIRRIRIKANTWVRPYVGFSKSRIAPSRSSTSTTSQRGSPTTLV